MYRRLLGLIKKLSWRVVTALAVFSVGSIAFVALAKEVRDNETLPLDREILLGIHNYATPTLDSIARILTQFGGVVLVPISALVIAGLFLKKLGRSYALLILCGVVGSSLLNLLLKTLFSRARPQLWERLVVEHSFSFPSGHAMASASLAASVVAALWYTRWRWTAILLGMVYITVVGFTRLYLGVHYPTDIVAGWMLAIAWVAAVFAIFSRSPYRTPVTEPHASIAKPGPLDNAS